MHEFSAALSFSLIPFFTALIFSLITPPFGATLSLRNEILLGIALPPVGSAVLAGALLAGVPSESTLTLYCITAVALFLLLIMLPFKAGAGRISLRRRELILAGLFCIGNALTMLIMSLSPVAEAHFKHLLQGELLAVNARELWIAAAAGALFLTAGIGFRGTMYAYALDEEGLFIKEKTYTRIVLAYRAAATLIVTGGIILIGPLLTTSFLIVPAFFCERQCRGLDPFMITAVAVGCIGTIAGFFLSIGIDLPPAPLIVSCMVAAGIFVRFLPGNKKRKPT